MSLLTKVYGWFRKLSRALQHYFISKAKIKELHCGEVETLKHTRWTYLVLQRLYKRYESFHPEQIDLVFVHLCLSFCLSLHPPFLRRRLITLSHFLSLYILTLSLKTRLALTNTAKKPDDSHGESLSLSFEAACWKTLAYQRNFALYF